jgi:hypothetical protein
MTYLMLRSALLSAATVAGLLPMLYLLFCLQLRRYEAAVSTDLLERWDQHLERLDPAERPAAAGNPPASVVRAMVELPSPLWRGRG